MPERAGFCTSIDKNNHHFGGMFARGQAWALEGLIPAYRILREDSIREVIDHTVGNLMKQQRRDGGWPYNLSRKMMGEGSARDRYPSLEKELPVLGSTRSLWGKMVLHDRLGSAYVYSRVYQFFLSTARKVMRAFRRI